MRSARILKQRIAWREFAPALIIVVNSLVWTTLTYSVFIDTISKLSATTPEKLVIFSVYFAGVACSAILGAMFFPRARGTNLVLWMLTGTATTVLLTAIANDATLVNIIISLFFGLSVGAGLPSCLAFFADVTHVENRGTHGGIAWSAVGFGILALALLTSSLDHVLTLTTLATWRAIGLVAFFLSRNKAKVREMRSPSYRSILTRRDVVLYMLPWIMFSLVNFAEAAILERALGEFYALVGFVEFALTGFFAIVAGILADIVGRKRIIIVGFIMLGIEYAMLSLFSGMTISWYLFTILDAFAWGMFASVFFMTLWGDLAEDQQKEKYYALGGLTYILAGFLPIIISPYVGKETVTAFSLASFFLFLAVLPMIYAPETLPEKRIKEMELKSYVEKAKKAREKIT